MALGLVKILSKNLVGTASKRLDNGNYLVQLGTQTLEFPPTDLKTVSIDEVRQEAAELRTSLMKSLPFLEKISKICPECGKKLAEMIRDKSD